MECFVSHIYEVMIMLLDGTEPLPEPMVTYSHFDQYEQTLMTFRSKYSDNHPIKSIWKSFPQKIGHLVQA